ncbi:MAG: transcription antitermination factor NusB [Planctomycetota bacterium]
MPRIAAWSVLRAGHPAPLREVARACAARGLDERDAALVRRLVGTEVRRRGTLRALVRAFVRGKPKPDLAAHLHLGLVQIFFLDRIPDHAAVAETVAAVDETLGRGKVRVVNAALRSAIRARRAGAAGDPRRDLVDRDLRLTRPVFRAPATHPFLWMEDAFSLPAALAKRWERRHGRERTVALARTFLAEPPLAVRGVGIDREEARALLAALGADPAAGFHPRVLRVAAAHTAAVTGSDAFRAGRLTVQGETALAAAELVEAREGERVLDLCAAPGGKTAVLAAAGARVVAVDVNPRRLARAQETCGRLGVAERVQLLAGDGAAALGAGDFDAVLVDAPCSNTGVLGARPAARWRFGPATQRELGALQARLLAAGAGQVRPGGRLVWSTCSLEPEENGQLVRAFLAGRAGWELEEEWEALPGPEGPVDGGYAARLRRR